MTAVESERLPRFRRRLVIRLCDILMPGSGMLLSGRTATGWVSIIVWALAIVSTASSVCLLGLHPLRGIVILGVLYAAMETLLALEPLGTGPAVSPASAFMGAGVFAVLLVAGFGLVIGPRCTALVVTDLCEYPGLLPGEVVLVRTDNPVKDPPGLGQLVAAQTDTGHVIARVAGLGGDRLDLSGPGIILNGAVVESEAMGTIRMPADEDTLPDETRTLRVYRESLGGVRHMFFFSSGVVLAPSSHEVPEGRVFLLCDNRSTAGSTDSRTAGAFSSNAVIGSPGMVIWSYSPGGRIRFDRIGAIWK